MTFLAPLMLAGLVALGLPVWLHLLKQHKTTPRPFASLMFFERRVQSSVRHRRLKYRVLFALRALFVALLIFAFARPVVQSAAIASAHSGRVLALLIDDSFSMRQGDRLSRARQQAFDIARTMGAADRAQVIVFGGPTRLASNLTNDKSAVLAAIASVEPGDGAGSLAEAVRAVRALAESAKTPVEAHVFSDFQKTGTPVHFADLALPPGTQLVAHRVAADAVPNLTVENVVAPRRLLSARSGRVEATVANYSSKDESERVTLNLNGRTIETKSLTVPAGGRASVEFAHIDAPYGLNRGNVSIDSHDAFPQDNHFWFSIERSDPAPALFIHDPAETRAGLYVSTALAASNQPGFTLNQATYAQAGSMDFGRFAFVILDDPAILPRGLETALTRYVRQGGSVLAVLGHEAESRVPVADLTVNGSAQTAPSGEWFTVGQTDETHPALHAPIKWDAIRFFRIAPVAPGTGRVLMRLDNGTPLLIEKAVGDGRVMVFGSGFDNVENDLPVRPAFVAFLEQVADYLGRNDSGTDHPVAGAFEDLRRDGNAADNAPIEVIGPDGKRVLSLNESTKARSIPLEREGFYEIRRPNLKAELIAVNPDRRESDFAVMADDTLDLWRNTGVRQTANPENGRGMPNGPQTSELWWYVMLAALGLAIAEMILGNRHLELKEGA